MKGANVLFFITLLSFYFLNAESEILQLSDASHIDDIKALEAIFVPCKKSQLHNCTDQVKIGSWMELTTAKSHFLVIDEVYDVNNGLKLKLLHPYLFKILTSEPLLMIPLLLSDDSIEIFCDSNVITRRHAESGFSELSPIEMLEKIRMEEKIIKNDLQEFYQKLSKQSKSLKYRNKFLLHTDDKNNLPKASQNVFSPNEICECPSCLNCIGLHLGDKCLCCQKCQTYTSEQRKLHIGFHPDGRKQDKDEGSNFPRHESQFFTYSRNLLPQVKQNYYTERRIDPEIFDRVLHNSYNQYAESVPRYQGSPEYFQPPNCIHNHFEPIDPEDNPNSLTINQGSNMIDKSQHQQAWNLRQKRSSSDSRKNRHLAINHKKTHRVKTRNVASLIAKQSPETTHRSRLKYSVYTLNSPIHHRSAKIQIFRKHAKKWTQILPETEIKNLIESFSSEGINIVTSSRMTFGRRFDFNRTKLLILDNDTSQHGTLMSPADPKQISKDEIQQAICPSSVQVPSKRSIMKLYGSNLMPSNNEIFAKCLINNGQICLYLKDESLPTWKFEITLPLVHNEIIDPRISAVKMSNIFIDTTEDVSLHAHFTVRSLDHFTKNFVLSLSDCELLQRLNISHEIILPPNKSVMINLTIPMRLYIEHNEEKCRANILDELDHVITFRHFPIKFKSRCFCVWECDCYCTKSFLTTESSNLCHHLKTKERLEAGFYDGENLEEAEKELGLFQIDRKILMIIPAIAFMVILLMGFLKAILGCCVKSVGSYKFNYLLPDQSYHDSNWLQKFVINLLFFHLLPIVWFKNCCSCGNIVDSDTSVNNRLLKRYEIYSDEDDEFEDNCLRPQKTNSNCACQSSETIFDATKLGNSFDDDSLIHDANYVVNAINDSHESLRKLEYDSHHSEENIINDPHFDEAKRLVRELLAARSVYRRFNKPIGSVKMDSNRPYSIRGYFLPGQGNGYQFITYYPIKQYYEITSILKLVSLVPIISLDPEDFRCIYANKMKVLEANDLSIKPLKTAPCINIKTQDGSMYSR